MSPRLDLLDWRRQVSDLYAEVRATADHAAGHARWRARRDALFATHPSSALPGSPGLPVADYDPSVRFEATVDTDVEPLRRVVDTGTDGSVAFTRVGTAALTGLGSLDVWWIDAYGGGLFVPVKDARAGRGTYGGGRYLLDTVKGADLGGDLRSGTLVLDLNFAYNPSCAYDPAWACPLAPPGNTLDVELWCGEGDHAG